MNIFSKIISLFKKEEIKPITVHKYKNPCNDVQFGDIVIGHGMYAKTICVDRYIGYNGYDNEYIPPYEGENFDYEDIEKFSEKRLTAYKEKDYDVIDFRDEITSNDWQLP